jgi:hypothetical protein
MRIMLLLAVLSLFAVQDWRRVTSNDEAAYSVLDARTDRSRGEVRVWERVDFRETKEGRKYRAAIRQELRARGVEEAEAVAYMTARHVYRCEEGQSTFEQVLYHNRRGQIVTEDPAETLGKWISPAPGSVAEALMLDACKRPVESQ